MTRHYLTISIIVAALVAALIYRRLRVPIDRLVRLGGTVAAAVVPRMLAVTTFLAGTILLFSGATPPIGDRLYWINHVLPLPVVEAAHFFGSIAGIGLLLLARGIQRRLDAAYHLSVALLAVAVLFTLLKGFDYEEAIFLSVLLALLIPNRRYFYRKASIIEERFTRGWILAIGLIVLGSIVLGYMSYDGIPRDVLAVRARSDGAAVRPRYGRRRARVDHFFNSASLASGDDAPAVAVRRRHCARTAARYDNDRCVRQSRRARRQVDPLRTEW